MLKNVLIASLLFLGGSQTTYAQDFLSAEQQEQVAENVKTFLYDLNLSERDKPAFRAIMSDFFTGLATLRATDFSMDTNVKIIKALVKGRDSRVKELLSSDQYKVYKARAKERRANIQEFLKEQ